jgi:hypothetical protein
MATLKRTLTLAVVAGLAFAGCGKLVGLNTPVTPLAQIQVQVADDIASGLGADAGVQTPNLRVGLVWGAQWQAEPFCLWPPADVMTPGSSGVQTVVAAGCPDSFRFVPDRDDADIAITPGASATITLVNLPTAEVMVGDLNARVAYASLVVYDDRNGNGTLDFHHPPRSRRNGEPDLAEDAGAPATWDVVYGASFISMTLPDQRVAYLEGTFDESVAFYPRKGCDPPLPSFSILSASGFSQADVSAAALQHQLPEEDDLTACRVATPDQAVVTIPKPDAKAFSQNPKMLAELACAVNDAGGTTFYRKPPATAPDLSVFACVGFPQIPGDDAGTASGVQLVVPSRPNDACQSVNHYILHGCSDDPSCATPWDVTPPSWWPCPITP